MALRSRLKQGILFIALLLASANSFSGGKLIGTPGASQLEGAGGGGLVPWAQLAGYATQDEILANGFISEVRVDDFQLSAHGAQINLRDRVELSYARQSFTIDASSTDIQQEIFATKIRLYGDLVYGRWPVISAGVQHKRLRDSDIAFALGASDDSGTDYYLAMGKAHLGAVAGFNAFWNLTLRNTEANQLGILGFGCPQSSCRETLSEFAAAVFVNQHIAVGVEYRQKPNQLALQEDDWRDVFIAWFPNKHLSVTAAYVDLGEIAGQADQTGWYLSLKGYL